MERGKKSKQDGVSVQAGLWRQQICEAGTGLGGERN